jgi:hypothetical protein
MLKRVPTAAPAKPQLERTGREGTESRLRLQTAVRLRWFGVAGQLVTVCYVYFVLGFQFDVGICLAPGSALRLPPFSWPTIFSSSPRSSISPAASRTPSCS